jgi:hypothetical protein
MSTNIRNLSANIVMHSWSNTRKQTNLGILIPDRVKTEASLGVVQEPVVLIGLGNGNDIYKK